MRIRRPSVVRLAVALLTVSVGPALAHHSLAERVKDGPAAANTRESYRCLELGEDIDKAVPLLVRSIELDPHGVGARLELADCYLQQHRPDAARNLAAVAMRLAIEQDKRRFIRRAEALLEEAGPGPQQTEAKR